MMALSIKQPWANLIASGKKTIETRLWDTDYRGPLLIVSSKTPRIEPAGYALAIANLVECRRMTKRDEVAAHCEVYPNAFAWVLANVRPITPFPVRGRLGLYEVTCPQTVDGDMPLFERKQQ
jgi:ASCH domain